MSRVEEILNFWFGRPETEEYGKPRKVWFVKKAEFDEEIRDRFESDCELAASGKLDIWQESADSCLALILLLDQFPRNLFRGTPRAFATDPQALAAARNAVDRGFDRHFLPVRRWFLYLPFEHAEDLQLQQQSVKLFEQLRDDPASASPIAYAIRHFDVVKRFGRFPHRNQILGRQTTPEEAEFLKQPGSSF